MKKIIIGAFAIIAVSAAFIFAGCEKDENTVDNLNIVNCWDHDANINEFNLDEGLFLSYPDNSEILINVFNGQAYTINGILLEDPVGQGEIIYDDNGTITGITCVPGGNNCGRAFVEKDGEIVKEGIYVHQLGDDGIPEFTIYDWNQLYRE